MFALPRVVDDGGVPRHLRNVSEGDALVEVGKDGYRATVLPLPPGEATLKVALVPVGELSGTVIGAGEFQWLRQRARPETRKPDE